MVCFVLTLTLGPVGDAEKRSGNGRCPGPMSEAHGFCGPSLGPGPLARASQGSRAATVTFGLAFSLVTFFWRTQKKVTRPARGETSRDKPKKSDFSRRGTKYFAVSDHKTLASAQNNSERPRIRPAVNQQILPGDIAGMRRADEGAVGADFLHLAKASRRVVAAAFLP